MTCPEWWIIEVASGEAAAPALCLGHPRGAELLCLANTLARQLKLMRKLKEVIGWLAKTERSPLAGITLAIQRMAKSSSKTALTQYMKR